MNKFLVKKPKLLKFDFLKDLQNLNQILGAKFRRLKFCELNQNLLNLSSGTIKLFVCIKTTNVRMKCDF